MQFIKPPFIYNLIKKFRTIRITIEKYRNIISNRKASLFERTINAIKKIQPTPRFNSQTSNIKILKNSILSHRNNKLNEYTFFSWTRFSNAYIHVTHL